MAWVEVSVQADRLAGFFGWLRGGTFRDKDYFLAIGAFAFFTGESSRYADFPAAEVAGEPDNRIGRFCVRTIIFHLPVSLGLLMRSNIYDAKTGCFIKRKLAKKEKKGIPAGKRAG